MHFFFRTLAAITVSIALFLALTGMNFSSLNAPRASALDGTSVRHNPTEPAAYRLFAEYFVQHYNKQTFEAIPKKFSTEMLQKVPAEKFVNFISGLRGGLGEIQSFEFVQLQENGLAVYQLSHGRLQSLLQFSMQNDGFVTGLKIVPALPSSSAQGSSNSSSTGIQQTGASKGAALTLQPVRTAEDFRAVLESVRAEYSLPSLAAVVLTSSGVRYLEAVGVRSTATKQPIDKSNLFHIGSNGKAMTGFLAARLVEAGIIGWKTKVLDIFPDFRSLAHAGYAETTFQDVLSHRSGVQSLTALRPGNAIPGLDFAPTTSVGEKRLELARWLLTQAPQRDSGASFTYSNAGYALAAAMIEKVSGKAWETLLDSLVWKPLGMKCVIGWANTADTTQPTGHIAQASGFAPQSPLYKLPAALDPAGNLSVSLPDYAKFLQAQLKGLQGTTVLVKPETYRFLHRSSPQYAIGWGWRQDSVYGAVSTHNGSAGTFLCHTSLLPEKNVALAIITNAAGRQSRDAVNRLREHLLPFIVEGGSPKK
jgi:CubicO group peptidase (beta-lactamase class C family)